MHLLSAFGSWIDRSVKGLDKPLKTVFLIGAFALSTTSSGAFAADAWKPSQSVVNRCNVYQTGAAWALMGKRGGASLEHMLSQVDKGRENEATKAVTRSGVRAAYASANQNFYSECLEGLRASDLEKQENINKVKGRWACQASGSADSTQIWLSYNPESTYSIGSPTKDWRHGTFTFDGDFVVEHLGGIPNMETKRRVSRDDNGQLSVNGMPCQPR